MLFFGEFALPELMVFALEPGGLLIVVICLTRARGFVANDVISSGLFSREPTKLALTLNPAQGSCERATRGLKKTTQRCLVTTCCLT